MACSDASTRAVMGASDHGFPGRRTSVIETWNTSALPARLKSPGDDHRRPLTRRCAGEVSILDDTRFPDCGDQVFSGIHADAVERGIAGSVNPPGDLHARRVHRPLLRRDADDTDESDCCRGGSHR